MEKKHFIITIDTESDNQWNSANGQTTENAKYIPRFQHLCEEFGFKPTYLIDFSMLQDPFLVDYLKKCNQRGMCEVGMHLHAWDTPPHHDYDDCCKARPYLIEYPEDVMRNKIATIHHRLTDAFECEVISHRAGRWATNAAYFDILSEFGYKVDCSYTPGISWNRSSGVTMGGSDYSSMRDEISRVGSKASIMEVPMSLKKVHRMSKPKKRIDVVKEPLKCIKGRYWWLRPALSSNKMMLEVLNGRQQNYAEFMMHSSELMPGGSPYFKTAEDIDRLYTNLHQFFTVISKDYIGTTLIEYYQLYGESFI